MTQVLQSWVADERLWLLHVRDDASEGWCGVLELLSLVTLVSMCALGWLAVATVLLRSV